MIISKFKEKPKTKIGWWAMGLGLGSILITMVSATPGAIIALAAVIVGIIAFIKGEHSWAVWFGFVPALLYAAFYVYMFVGEGLLK